MAPVFRNAKILFFLQRMTFFLNKIVELWKFAIFVASFQKHEAAQLVVNLIQKPNP